MNAPPEPVLAAPLHTLRWALIYARNLTYQPSTEAARQIHDLMDALHEIPGFLADWCSSRHPEELRLHLACFDHRRWPGAPDLVAVFEHKLAELTLGA